MGEESDDLDTNRLATAPRPGTTLRPEASAKNPQQLLVNSRPRTLSGRPLTGMVRNSQGKCLNIKLLDENLIFFPLNDYTSLECLLI